MATTIPSARPGWQRNPAFKFFASVKLAVILLAVLIVAAIAGTIYESSFDAKVARAYVYGAPWFNAWLILLAANLAVSAFSRWPWRKHHVAFLVTHLGIITLLTGSLIGRIRGIEGTMTLFKGEPATNRLLVDQHQLRVRDTDGVVKGFAAEFLNRPPTPSRPKNLGRLASGARLSVIEYAPAIEGRLNPKSVSEGVPAVHFTIKTAMMGQRLESWLLADDRQHGTFAMGLANIELKRGVAPAPSATPAVADSKTAVLIAQELEETIFAFSKAPDEQIGRVIKGGSVGAKVRLDQPESGNKGRLSISVAGKERQVDVAENLGRETAVPGTVFTVKIDDYWADFRIQEGKPASVSDKPNNPAVLVTIRGKGVPAAPPPSPHDASADTNQGGAPVMPGAGAEAPNRLTLFVAEEGAITYELISRKGGTTSGKIEINQPLTTGWADWQLTVDRVMPHAEQWMDFSPAKPAPSALATANLPDGVRIRLDQGGKIFEQWVPAGWQITVPTSPAPTMIAYGWKIIPLPIGLELLDFEVKRNEGNDSPAGFKSTLRISTADGETTEGQCWMNHPLSYPASWRNTWTGLTYKISQASWNPNNLGQSSVQILRDPGWLLKWVGSLLVVSGVFMLFYVRPFRRQMVGEPITPSTPAEQPAKTKSSRVPAAIES